MSKTKSENSKYLSPDIQKLEIEKLESEIEKLEIEIKDLEVTVYTFQGIIHEDLENIEKKMD